MKKHFLKRIFKGRRKLIIALSVGLAIVIVLGAATYIFALKADKDAQNSLVASSDKVASLTSGINSKLADKTTATSDKIASIKGYSAEINKTADQLCERQKGHVYSFLITTLDRCERAKARLDEIASTMDGINRYLESDASLASLIPAKLDSLTFTQSYEAWNGALGAIDAMDVPSELKDQKTALIKAMTDYRDSWKALVDADSAHDEAAFVAAQDLLQKNHQVLLDSVQNKAESFQEMSTILTTQLSGFFEESKAP